MSMSTTAESRCPTESVVYVSFNQDHSLLLVGTKTGYIIYSLSSLDALEEIYRNETEEIFLVQTLFSADRLVFVSASNPFRLSLFQYKQEKELFSYSYLHKVIGVQLNRLRLIVCLEQSIDMHDLRDMRHLHTIHDTPANRQGVCALCLDSDHSYLAYPGSIFAGEINIFDTVNLKAVTVIRAHDSPIAAVAFDSTGSLIATASEKGTVIRVFAVKDGQKLYDFRRGVKRFASIYSLHFSLDSAYLSCSSNTESVHVFKLESPSKVKVAEEGGWMDYFGQAIRTSASYLPAQVTEMLSQGRDFAIARLPSAGLKSVCAIVSVQDMPRLLVATQDGYLYIYSVEPSDGGQCNLLRQHRIDSAVGRKMSELYEPVLTSVANDTTEPMSCGLNSCFPFTRTSAVTGQSVGAERAGSEVPPVRQSYASVVMNRRDGPQNLQPDDENCSLEKSPSWQDEMINEVNADERDAYQLSDSEFPSISLRPK